MHGGVSASPVPPVLLQDHAGWRWPWRRRVLQADGGIRSRQHGSTGIEFAGHRAYAKGEDPRHVDWNLYARTGRLFTKQREVESGNLVSVVFDGSASMEVGGGDKGRLARQVAAALAQNFVASGEKCRVIEFAEGLHRSTYWVAGRRELPHLATLLEPPQAARATDWTRSLGELQAMETALSPIVILSDFWGGEEMADALRNLAASGREMLGIQILLPEEINPRESDVVRWTDSETGESITLRPDAGLCAEYRRALAKRQELLHALFSLSGGTFLTLSSAKSFREALKDLQELRARFPVR